MAVLYWALLWVFMELMGLEVEGDYRGLQCRGFVQQCPQPAPDGTDSAEKEGRHAEAGEQETAGGFGPAITSLAGFEAKEETGVLQTQQ